MGKQLRTMAAAAEGDPRLDAVADGMASVRQAAEFLSVSRTTLYAFMDSEGLAYAKFGRGRRLPWKALRAFAAARLQGQAV
jgi:excisionase family DNA binding protein